MNIRKILIAGLMFILMIIIGTAGYEWTEHLSFFNALWLTVVSILTIGYGDMYPVTFTGKIFTLILIPIAIGLVTYILAQFAAALIEGKFTSEVKRRKMNAKINRLHQHIIVCGYGRVGKQVISQLEKEGKPLVVIEKNSQELENTSNLLYITGDATDDDVLIAAGIKRADCLVLALPKDSDNVFITLTAKGMNPDIWIVTRAEKHESERKLYSAGADKVINTASIGGHRIAMSVLRPVSVELVENVLQNEDAFYSVEEIIVGGQSPLSGRSLKHSRIREMYGVTVLALKRGEKIINNPEPFEPLLANDIVIVFGPDEKLRKFEKVLG
ncbi:MULTISPECIES: potassium channel family protein [Heyndrickxia]|uniref:potassium channel family protein n=1 Tax=Heyndrickxia TaxID=2837504 RepID=UPI002235F331|nr:potassium channel protein [Heyndrickxia coagulans]UZH06947.1 NAD-binding protein [Heyndrickxia coagulans]